MHPYTRRNICAWHQRFFQQGWIVRVLNRLPSSPFNDANFLNISDPGTFPRAFVDGTIGGDYAPHAHVRPRPVAAPAQVQQCVYGCSDDPDRRLGPPVARNSRQPSRFKVLSYNTGGVEGRSLTNYFLASGRNSSLFARCCQLLLRLWAARRQGEH
jgi:hypothetical protein